MAELIRVPNHGPLDEEKIEESLMTREEQYWLDSIFKPICDLKGNEDVPQLDDDELAQLDEFYSEDE